MSSIKIKMPTDTYRLRSDKKYLPAQYEDYSAACIAAIEMVKENSELTVNVYRKRSVRYRRCFTVDKDSVWRQEIRVWAILVGSSLPELNFFEMMFGDSNIKEPNPERSVAIGAK